MLQTALAESAGWSDVPEETASTVRWKALADEISVLCVRWYLRDSLSYRAWEEMMAERHLSVDHTTIWRWGSATPRCWLPGSSES